MTDYDRIAAVIRHLEEHHATQPDLTSLAKLAGLSAAHFHRLFTRWAGVTPKDFVQCLTLAHAKDLLRSGESVLGASLEVGLSGPGRLHDLCVGLEAASPGEIATGGRGWTLRYGFADSPFGPALIAETPRGVSRIAFLDGVDPDPAKALVQEDWPAAKLERDDRNAARIAGAVFRRPAPSTAQTGLKAYVRGTPFQVSVWRGLLSIPPGMLTSYGVLARHIGNPTATRAVGTAVGANPLAFVIPCHRVIQSTGVIGNYRWGPLRKRAILAWEGAADAS